MRPWNAAALPGLPFNQALGVQTVYQPGTVDDALLTAGSGGGGTLTNTDGQLRRSFAANQAARYRTAYEHERTGAGAILWAGTLLGAPTTAACLGGLTYASTNISPFAALELKRRSVSSNNLILTHSVGGSSQQIISTTLITSGPVVLVGTAAGNSQALWILDQATGAVSVVRGTVAGQITTVAGARFEVGDSFNSRNPNAACELMALFNRALSDDECLMLLANPYAVFAPSVGLAAFGPPASSAQIITASLDALVLADNAATLRRGVVATTDALTLGEHAASPRLTVGAGADALTLAEGAATPRLTVGAAADALALSEYAGTLRLTVRAGADALAIAEPAAIIALGAVVIIGASTDALVISRGGAVVRLGLNAVADALALVERQATIVTAEQDTVLGASLEFTVLGHRLHWTAADGRAHYTMTGGRCHYDA